MTGSLIAWLNDLLVSQALLFTLVLGRTSGLIIGAPILGGQEAPMQFRALLAVALAVLMLPAQQNALPAMPQNVIDYGLLMATELGIGLLLGLAVTTIFSGLQITGQVIGQLSGMALAEVFNPAAESSMPLISHMLYMFTLAIFVLIGGHRLLVGGLLESFHSLPPGYGTMPLSIGETLSTLAAESFVLGIRAAAPAATALLLSTLVMGLVSRTLPQLNILSFGFALSALVSYGSLAASLGAIAYLAHEYLEPAVNLALATIGR